MVRLLPYSAYLADTNGGSQRVEINESHFHDLIRSALQGIDFDEQWYRRRYRDVDQAVASGELESGFDHYCNVGYFEGRLPRAIKVDDSWYLDAYSDVLGAIRRGKVESAQDHFEIYGFSEGRLPYQGWQLAA